MSALNEMAMSWEPCQKKQAYSPQKAASRANLSHYAATMRRLVRREYRAWGEHADALATYRREVVEWR